MSKAKNLIFSTFKCITIAVLNNENQSRMVAQDYDPNTGEAEAGEVHEVLHQLQLHKSWASLNYSVGFCLKQDK